jgi:hypothetical protein
MAVNEPHVARRWRSEPLGRFLLLGGALLAVDHLVGREEIATREKARTIVVSASRKGALVEAFRAEHSRAPGGAELRALLDRWVDEEVLYREALALGLDRGDTVVQRQLTQKMRFLIDDVTTLPEPSPADLEAWLDEHAERYGRGPLVSFEQVFLSRGRHGDGLAAEAARVAERLHRTPDAFVGVGDPFLVGQVVTDADAVRLRREFGAGFDEVLAGLPSGEWSGPVASAFGLHLVRVTARAPFTAARLADVADRVRLDFDLARREERNRAAVAELRDRYEVVEDVAG